MNSSRNESQSTLASVSAGKAELKFLLDLVNLQDDLEATIKFAKRYDGLWPVPQSVYHWLVPVDFEGDQAGWDIGPTPKRLHKVWLLPLRDALRTIWTAPDQWTRE